MLRDGVERKMSSLTITGTFENLSQARVLQAPVRDTEKEFVFEFVRRTNGINSYC